MRDITLGETFDTYFVTTEPDTGAPATLSGTPAISAYVGNSTTEITSGITLTADFDSVTGLNHVRVVATSGNGFADNTDVALVITTGTVDSQSAVGYVVERFTIGRSAASTTADAILTDTEAVATDAEAILTDTEAAAPVLTDTEALVSGQATILTDTEALQPVITDAEAILTDTEALITDAEAILADTEAGGAGITVAQVQAGFGVYQTTIATLSSQTSFTLTDGSSDDDAYNGYACIVVDQSTATQQSLGKVSDYTGSSKTITLDADPGIFTAATGDTVILLPADFDDTMLSSILTDTEAIITDSEAILADTEAGGAGLDAEGVRDAIGLASANLDTQLGGILTDTEAVLSDTETAATANGNILTDTEALLVDTEASQSTEAAILADTEAATGVITDTEALLTDTEALRSGVNVTQVNSVTVDGDGSEGDPWGPA